jgi:hypothetical protein
MSSSVQPCNDASSGRMAYRGSLRTEDKLGEELRAGCGSGGTVTSVGWAEVPSSLDVGYAPGIGGSSGRWKVGRRLTHLPRDGTNREFWMFVMDESVATSGSVFHRCQSDILREHRVWMKLECRY